MASGIYRIDSVIDGRFYIGSSINMDKRWWKHRWHLKRNSHPNYLLQNFFNKYGLDSLRFSVLENCSVAKLFLREQYYLDTLKPQFNISQSAWSPATTSSVRIKMSLAQTIAVYQYSLSGEFIRKWASALEAGRKLKTHPTAILRCCGGHSNSSAGYIWRKKKDSCVKPYASAKPRKVYQYDSDFKLIGTHKTIKDAAKAMGVKPSSVSKSAKRGHGRIAGFYVKLDIDDPSVLIEANKKRIIFVFDKNKRLLHQDYDRKEICRRFGLKINDLSRHLNSRRGIPYKGLLFSYENTY